MDDYLDYGGTTDLMFYLMGTDDILLGCHASMLGDSPRYMRAFNSRFRYSDAALVAIIHPPTGTLICPNYRATAMLQDTGAFCYGTIALLMILDKSVVVGKTPPLEYNIPLSPGASRRFYLHLSF